MSTLRKRQMKSLTLDRVKAVLREAGLNFTENGTLRSSYIDPVQCDLVLTKHPSVGFNATADGVECVGDFYHVRDIFNRPVNDHNNPSEFMSSVEAGDTYLQYKNLLTSHGASFTQAEMKPEGQELVLRGTVPVMV